jgi:predicted component of type VI protein secretion system
MKAGWLLVLASIVGVQACGSRASAPPPPPTPPKLERLTLSVRAVALANDGRSVRFLIRRVAAKQFVQETYATLVALAENPDDTILADQLLRPSTSIRLTLPLEAGSTVGVYFFYAEPRADSWRLLIPASLGEVTVQAQQHAAYMLQ